MVRYNWDPSHVRFEIDTTIHTTAILGLLDGREGGGDGRRRLRVTDRVVKEGGRNDGRPPLNLV